MKEEKYIAVNLALPERVYLWATSQAYRQKLELGKYLVKVLDEQIKKCK